MLSYPQSYLQTITLPHFHVNAVSLWRWVVESLYALPHSGNLPTSTITDILARYLVFLSWFVFILGDFIVPENNHPGNT